MKIRQFTIDVERAAQDTRSVPCVISSDSPVDVGYGPEVLQHDADSIDMGRAPLPVLTAHNANTLPVGVAQNLRSDGHRLHAEIRFGKSAAADEVWRGVQDGIVRALSVGYSVQKSHDENGRRIVSSWTPIEVSAVAAGADINAGFFRQHHEVSIMSEDTDNAAQPREKAGGWQAREERERVESIQKAAENSERAWGDGEFFRRLALECISRGLTTREFCKEAYAHISTKGPVMRSNVVSMTGNQDFSLRRAILGQIDKSQLGGAQIDAGFEVECSQEITRSSGRKPRGIFMPLRARALSAGTPSAGGDLVETSLLSGNFVDLLRNKTQVVRLGATQLEGLVGNIAIPRATSGATASWVSESGTISESDPAFDQVSLTPHMLAAKVTYSRQLILQSTPQIEGLLRQDLARQVATAVDAAAIAGTGSSNQPTGILNTSGIGSVAIATNGGAPTYAGILGLYKALASANADRGQLSFLTNSSVKAKLLQTPKLGSTMPEFVWEPDTGANALDGRMIGYRAAVSENVPSDLTKGTGTDLSACILGNWSDLLIGMWGGLDILVDPYSNASTGQVSVYAYMATDIAVRHPESFAAVQDIATS